MNQVISFRGLYDAYRDCRQRKRRTANAQRYDMRLLDNLYDTLAALQNRSYSPHRSIRFVAQKPKAREIHAADFRDRVVHHWLVPRLEALFEPIFIHDVYSNRVGKGTHKAVDRLQSFMHSVGNDGWFLQLDIANFFNTIDRPILFKLVQQRLRKATPPQPSPYQGREQEAVQILSPPLIRGGREGFLFLRWLTHTLLKHDASRHSVYRGNLHEKLQALQAQIVRGYVHSGYTLSLQPEVMAQLQATLASYRGHFKHANSYHLQQQIQQEFPWLALLSGYEPLPANLVGYKSQIRFFQQHYPHADLHIQRGMEIDVVKPLLPPSPLAGEGLGMGGNISRVDIREYGHLKGGLKRRIVYRLIIKPGVELCQNQPKRRY